MKEEIQIDNLYNKIAGLLQMARQSIVRTIDHTMVYTYFEIGRMIVENEQQGKERAEYGKQIIKGLSQRLRKKFGKGFSVDNLENMRRFYRIYSISETLSRKSEERAIQQTPSAELQITDNKENVVSTTILQKSYVSEIWQTLSANSQMPVLNLSWSHYLILMRMDDISERNFYEIESVQNNWSVRELKRNFDSALYQRLALSRDKEKVKELALQGQLINKPEDAIKDPYILEFLDIHSHNSYSETELEQAVIDKLQLFLKELGKGFMFVNRQERISFDERHFYIDLVFYNRLLRCFVLIDLKIGDLKHQDLGQMQMYVNYYDRFVKLPEENKTVGIVLCRDKSDTLVEITLPEDNDQIFASRYKTVLPDKEELRKLLSDKDFDL
jgi:predicted nuclease of restriction endonuclease-like (RecB) superfamily